MVEFDRRFAVLSRRDHGLDALASSNYSDAGKKVKERRIHAVVDTEGLPRRVVVHSAGIQDRFGATLILDKMRNRFPRLGLVWADNGLPLEIVKPATPVRLRRLTAPLGRRAIFLLVRP
jgi:hypothetical protein